MKEIKESSFLFRLYAGVTNDRDPKDFCNFSWVVIFILFTLPLSAPVFFISWILSKINGTRTLDEIPKTWHKSPIYCAGKLVGVGLALYSILFFIIIGIILAIEYYIQVIGVLLGIITIILFINIPYIYAYIKSSLPNMPIIRVSKEPEEADNSMGVFEMITEKVKAFKEKRCPRIKIIRDEE